MSAVRLWPAGGGGRGACLARVAVLAALCAVPALASEPQGGLGRAAVPASHGAAFAIVSRSPAAELLFRGMRLTNWRPRPEFNELVLDFAERVDGELFVELERQLPEWIEFAYAGYDSAVIRAKHPADFAVEPVAEGFRVRITFRGSVSHPGATEYGAELARLDAERGDPSSARSELLGLQREDPRNPYVLRTRAGVEARVGDWEAAQRYYALALAERPYDEGLREAYDTALRETGSHIAASGEWRRTGGDETLITAQLDGGVALSPRWKISASASNVTVDGDIVQQPDGTDASVSDNVQAASLGIAYMLRGGDTIRLEGIYGEPGPGGRLAFLSRSANSETEAVFAYHEPYPETAEAIAADAVRDRAEFRHARRIARGLWGEAALRVTRYGVDDSDDVARTAGFAASLRFVRDLFGWSAGVAYEIEGEYVFDREVRLDPFATPFTPLGIRNRELHAPSGSLGVTLARDLWLDAYAGYAYDRYGGNGPFGGAALRYTPLPGFEISLGASHTEVSGRPGEEGATTSAGISVSYKLRGPEPEFGHE